MALIMLFLIVFQTIVLSRLRIFGISADLPVAFAVLLAYIGGPREGFWFGALAGFSADVFSPERFVFVVAVSLTCFFLGILKERFFSEEETIMFFFVFAGTFLSYLFGSWMLAGLYDKALSGAWVMILSVSLLNAFFTPYLKALILKADNTDDGQRIKI